MTNTSKIDVATRRAIVKPVTEFARANELPVGFVMSALLWLAETRPEEILSLINLETIKKYQAELSRRETARQIQVKGMVSHALPAAERTEENVQEVTARVFEAIKAARKLSIPALKAVINSEVAALGTKNGATG